MKNILSILLLLSLTQLFGQPNTEVYLTDITTTNGETVLSNLRNISNNEGYDNQPSFYDEHTILFASTRNKQTDIAKYDTNTGEISWVTNTAIGSEYSPLRIPNSTAISAVRLDTTGYQRLYRYNSTTGTSKPILKNQKVGYHVWYSKDVLVTTVLVADRMDLIVANLQDNSVHTVYKNVGRSLHKIPNTELISYIAKEEDAWSVKSLHPTTGDTKLIFKLAVKTEDINWLPDGSLLIPEKEKIYKLNPASKAQPAVIKLLADNEINAISRLAVSANGKQLALVSAVPSYKIVQKQVDSYNAGNLEAFVNCFTKDVVVKKFPTDTLYVGHEKMRQNYKGLSPQKRAFTVEVAKRITLNNIVIDQEKLTRNNKIQMQVALYEVKNTAIANMFFIFDDTNVANPEVIVQKQLDAYNARDIDGFLQTYAPDIAAYNFPATKTMQGLKAMRERFSHFFASTPDLHCEIKNRIVIGNKVIDEEHITINGNSYKAVAIYEVKNGKIAKVTFIQE